ncbi:MAG TPA: AraC family transcriptional regulator [Polyangiaceae bacterium]|nr:AraC family transcriptional regulator [Polyangiaceae bacterium]
MTDTLSDVLRAVRLSGAVFFAIDAAEPWVAEAPPASAIAPHIMPGAEHVIEYHVVTKGTCWGGIVDDAPVKLEAGDIIVFPQGDPHVLASAPGMRGQPSVELHREASRGKLPLGIHLDGGGANRVEVICGFFGCDACPFNPLLTALPRLLHVRSLGESDSVLRGFVELALSESTAPRSGSECVLSRLSELLFVEVVRRYVAALPSGQLGWLAGLRDESIGKALEKLHDRPSHPWTLEELARECATSRSVLAERFALVVGVPPMHYLAQWRIQLAASMLRNSSAGLAEIAGRVGYGSEAALSRAFKRWVGVAPASYRRGESPAPPHA